MYATLCHVHRPTASRPVQSQRTSEGEHGYRLYARFFSNLGKNVLINPSASPTGVEEALGAVMSDTPLKMFSSVIEICLLITGMFGLYLAHHFFFEALDRPWVGYARHIESGRPEFWFDEYETRRDCLEGVTYSVGNQPHGPSYSMPVGCGYQGNNSWLVRTVNLWSMGNDLHCIARITSPRKDEARYEPILRRLADMPMRGPDWYCL